VPAAKIVVDTPLAKPLSRGVAFIHYRTPITILVDARFRVVLTPALTPSRASASIRPPLRSPLAT
jgi:hypothetical protein